MQRRTIRRGLSIAAAVSLGSLLLSAGASVSAAGPAAASCSSSSSVTVQPTPVRQGRIAGIIPMASAGPGAACASIVGGSPLTMAGAKKFNGKPPLFSNGGPVMGTASVRGKVTVTPIYWAGPTLTFATSYKNVVTHYVRDIAQASGGLPGALTNVYSVDEQLGINYDPIQGTAITDTTNAFPTSGPESCTPDNHVVYSDSTGYSSCVTDAGIQAELARLGLTADLAHLYLVILPQGVESCAGTSCSSPYSKAGFCGYHSFINGGTPATSTFYADIPYPSYGVSISLPTCAPVLESLNGNQEADVAVSIVSHEVNEAITDPVPPSGFVDAKGFEIGDECGYIYGTLSGAPVSTQWNVAGAQWNQTINGDNYFTQEEASNENFNFAKHPGHSPCVQHVDLPLPFVKIKPKTLKVGKLVTFDAHKTQGNPNTLAYSWSFGDLSSPASGAIVTHTYAAAGTYTVTLTVTDTFSLQVSQVVVSQPITVVS